MGHFPLLRIFLCIFVYRAFFPQKSLCSKNRIWGIFSPKMGHFFHSDGLATLMALSDRASTDNTRICFEPDENAAVE